MTPFNGAAVLVTGATGFVGRHLCDALERAGARVFGLSRGAGGGMRLAAHFAGDLAEPAFVRATVSKVRPEFLFHLAANKTRTVDAGDFRRGIDQNILGTLNLVEACMTTDRLRRVVALGTCEEYGNAEPPFREQMRESPISAYSFSKAAVTHLLLAMHRIRGFPVVILRPTLAFGPGQSADMFLPALIQALIRGERFAMTAGGQSRDFVYIDDLCDAILRAGVRPRLDGTIINIGSGESVNIRDVALMVADLLGGNAQALLGFGERPYRSGEAMRYWADRGEAGRLLGWEPLVSMREGLARTAACYRSQL